MMMDQQSLPFENINVPQSFLSSLVENCFGGDGYTLIIADVPKVATVRSLTNFLQILDSIRLIKNHPTANLESPEMLELGVLVEAHNRLELEHRAVRREMKQLQKALKLAEIEKDELLTESELNNSCSETHRYQVEYELARINMEKLTVHEKIRQCEIDLVCMEHERLLLIAEMDLKQKQLALMEEKLNLSLSERETLKTECSSTVNDLKSKLDEAQKSLQNSDSEMESLGKNLADATKKISFLESKIKEIEERKCVIEGQLMTQTQESSKSFESKDSELKSLKQELEKTKQSEAKLLSKLSALEEHSTAVQNSVSELEGKIATIKLENVALQTKLELYQQKPKSPDVSRTIKLMEEKWQEERQAMHSIVDDLRKMIKEKESIASESILKTLPLVEDNEDIIVGSIGADADAGAGVSTTKNKKPKVKSFSKVAEKFSNVPKGNDVTRRADPKAIDEDNNDKIDSKASVAVPTRKSQQSRRKGAKIPKDVGLENDSKQTERKSQTQMQSLSLSLSSSSTSPKQLKRPKEIQIQPIELSNNPNPPSKSSIKLQRPRSNKRAGNPVNEKPIGKILEPEVEGEKTEIVIPGTPQKVSQSTAQSVSNSPAKIWKPSAFIPGVKMKKSEQIGSEPTAKPIATLGGATGGLFAGLSFVNSSNNNGDGFRKRIKLPDRNKPLEANNPTNPIALHRRNVDPTVFSTIMNSFDIPNAKK